MVAYYGGFDEVCKQRRWTSVSKEVGYHDCVYEGGLLCVLGGGGGVRAH